MTESPVGAKPDIEDGSQRLARFHAVLTLAHTDAQLIWSRYYSLLTANAIVAVVLGALVPRTNPSLTEKTLVLLVALFGLALTWEWKRLTQHGWKLLHYWVDEAKGIWPGVRNPYAPYSDWCKATNCGEGTDDWISRHAQRVINLFLIGYSATAVVAAYSVLRHIV